MNGKSAESLLYSPFCRMVNLYLDFLSIFIDALRNLMETKDFIF